MSLELVLVHETFQPRNYTNKLTNLVSSRNYLSNSGYDLLELMYQNSTK